MSNEGENGKKYQFRIRNRNNESIVVDVYDLIDALGMTCPALQHLFKKLCFTGNRGMKTIEQDLMGINSASIRAIELHKMREHTKGESTLK